MTGFFSLDVVDEAPIGNLPKCGACGLHKTCLTPKMRVYGKGKKGIMVIGEAPGAEEDKKGRPFIGDSGQELREELETVGINLDRDCWTTNALICRPPDNKITDAKAIEYCRPNIVNAITMYNPEKILLLGASALESVVTWLYGHRETAIGTWAGWQIPSITINSWVLPTFHPSYVIRSKNDKKKNIVQLLFRKHLSAFADLNGRPYRPGFKGHRGLITAIASPTRAASLLKRLRKSNERLGAEKRPLAFDYETTMKKPDHPLAEIYTCAVSDGKTTLAYPWQGPAITETKKLLATDAPKYGANIKFEQRWSDRFGIVINNWKHDVNLGARQLDNREGVTGVKFQAFVRLGEPIWDKQIAPYLKGGKGGYGLNRIKEIKMQDLLVYNGMDALLEWKICRIQIKELKL